uniref:Neutral/alkaline non-lysosomal ceramidase C-terminal domain-containing protein n=1 Tax=Heliothis virescens TaxID=7102 RepID=A0A2A4K824_HELVI
MVSRVLPESQAHNMAHHTLLRVAANPRNDLKQESSHAVIERLELSQWVEYTNDADWDTRFIWERVSTLTGTSQVTFEWKVPESAILASYRIVYRGASRGLLGNISPFQGVSNAFQVIG